MTKTKKIESQKIMCPQFKRNALCHIDASIHKQCGRYACSLELKDLRVNFEGAR